MRKAAVETVIAEQRNRVFTLAVYLLGDREEAEDVTQEALLQCWRRGDEVASERLPAWLLRVARNRCIDRLRARRGRQRLLPRIGGLALPDPVDGRPGPESVASGRELQAAILRALGGLAEPYRSVVILREIQGLSYEEIAAALEMPLNTVRVTLHRGRRKLREELKEEHARAAAC